MSKVAAIQMASGPNVQANLAEAARLIDNAVSQGAEMVVLPENFAMMSMTEQERVGIAEQPGEGVIQDFLRSQSKKHKIWLVGGTIPMVSDVKGKARASCLVMNSEGEQVARYDKIHMFDVLIEDSQERYSESETTDKGDEVVVVDSPLGRLGIAICYDLRFPVWARNVEAYDILLYVANWPKPRIAAWDALLKARAIENMSYCIGVNRVGVDINGYEYSGHSAVYDVLGNRIDTIPFDKEHTEVVTLNKRHIDAYRNKLKFLDDKDDFILK